MVNQDQIEQLFNTMSQLKKLISHHTSESHEEKVATMLQFSALKFLKNKADCTVGELAQFIRLSKSSTTQLVERLVKAGSVIRIHDKTDRRIVHISITPEGEKELEELKKNYLEKLSKVFAKVPSHDLQTLIRIQSNLIETLKKEQEK